MSEKVATQLERLEAARKQRDGKTDSETTTEETPERKRNADGTFAKDESGAETATQTDDGDGGEGDTDAGDDDDADTRVALDAPTSVKVTINGEEVEVDPALGAAFVKADEIEAGSTKPDAALDRQAIVNDVVTAITPLLKPATSSADEAAVTALADADEQSRIDKLKPDSKLLVEDPAKWQEQHTAYEKARDAFIEKKAKRDAKAEMQRDAAERSRGDEAATMKRAREVLSEQFYGQYTTLNDPAMRKVVDRVLGETFDEIVSSGVLTKPMSAAESEKLKHATFAKAARKAATELVAIKQAGKKVVRPTPTPEARKPVTTVTTQPQTREKPPKKEAPKPKERYPADSMSAQLAAVRAKKFGRAS